MNTTPRKIWEQPWKYVEGFIIAGGIAFSGLLLQIVSGNIQPMLFAFPANAILGALFVGAILCTHFLFRKKRLVQWMSGVYATIPALVVLLAIIVVMGLIPQFSEQAAKEDLPANLFSLLGWHRMTTSWIFILLSFYLLTILGLATLKRTIMKPSWRDVGFYMNHLGLFIAFAGGILGSTDMQRLTISVKEGEVEWRAQSLSGEIKELPIAIQLDTFMMEEYPPKLVMIDNQTGKMLPEGHPDTYMFEGVGKTAKLAGATLEILDYMPHAGMIADSTFVNFVPLLMDGATTAIQVRVSKPSLPQPVEGWVSNGSFMFPYHVLYVDETTSIAMPVQEVKKYTSIVTVFTEAGHSKHAHIEVNKPLSIEDWIVYQYSYDESMGKYSETSIFELIRDPWLKVVYTGVFMLLAGALYLFIVGPKKKTV